jgi:hypothetical protein
VVAAGASARAYGISVEKISREKKKITPMGRDGRIRSRKKKKKKCG